MSLLRGGLAVLLAAAFCAEPESFGDAPIASSLFPRRAFRAFDQVTTAGLPQYSVQALAQDADGVLWIATFDGVATFDGRELKSVAAEPEAPLSGPYYAITPRRMGGVYVGGAQGVHVHDGRAWRLWRAPGTVAAIGEGRHLWILELSGRVWRRDEAASVGWIAVTLPTHIGPAVGLAVGQSGGLWVVGRGGVARIADDTDVETPALPTPSPPTTILLAKSGTSWVGTEAGEIYWLGTGKTRWVKVDNEGYAGGRIRSLAEDRRGRIWAGGNHGRVTFGGEAGRWTSWGAESGLRDSAVSSILGDREGTLWFGTVTRGLQQWSGEAWSHRTSERGHVLVSGIEGTAEEGLLVAAFSDGVWHWDASGSVRVYDRRAGLTEDARAAVSPSPGVVWVGTRFGIFESEQGQPFRQTLNLRSPMVTGISVTGFFRAPAGEWYAVSSSEGIFRRGPAGWHPASELNRDLPDQSVRSMIWRRSGELWVATLRGVTVFSGGSGRTLAVDAATGVPRLAQSLLEVGDDEVWVGAFGGIGIWRGGAFKVLTERDGLPGKTIYALRRARDGAIWAGGSAGVGRFYDGRWTIYDTRNGLLSNECNVNALHTLADGSVLVGTVGSLARFDPSVTPLAPPPLRVVWREVPATDGGRLAPGVRSARLTWSAPWLLPGQVVYRTRVPRMSKEWSPPRVTPDLTLASLGPGEWVVEVAARLDEPGADRWSEPRALRLYVAPTFWETAWAWLFYAVLGVALVAAIVRLRTGRLRRRARELQEGIDASIAQIKVLRGLLPICSVCKKIRDDTGYWNRIEKYLGEHSEAAFTHGFCPDCFERLYGPPPPNEPVS